MSTYAKTMRSFWSGPGGLYELLKISIPASVSQACFSIMMFTDRLLLTPLGVEAPAASMVAGFTSFLFTVFFCGFLGYITPLTGQLIGAKREEKVTNLVHQGIIISLVCYPIILLLGFYFAPIYFDWTDIPQKQKVLAQSYFDVINFGSFFTLFSVVFGSFFSGIGKTHINMRVNIIGMLLNIPLSYYLIKYGFLGYFKGVEGAALGSLLSSMAMCFMFLVSFLKTETAKRFQSNLRLKVDLDICKTLVKFGSATGMEMTLAFVCFSTFVAMFHSYGSSEALSATIALNWEILAFLPTWGISIGLMSLVGRYMGSRDFEKVYRSIKSSMLLTLLTMLLACVLFFFKTEALITPFLPEGASEDILPLASLMLKIVCIYCLANGINLTMSGTLRASGDTRAVMSIVLLGDFIMIFASYYMIKKLQWNPLITWTFFSASMFIQTILFGFRFWQGRWKDIRVL